MSNSLHPYGLQHTSHTCPSLFPRICSDSCLLSQWCYLTISSPVALFSFCLQSFPASESFLISQLFTSSDQSTGASASASIFPMSIQCWFLLEWTGLIAMLLKRLSKSFLAPQFETINSLVPCQTLLVDFQCCFICSNHEILCTQPNIF